MRNALLISIPLVLMLVPAPASAEKRVAVEAFLGTAHNFRTPLTVEQAGHNEIALTADYSTRAFQLPLYYAVRLDIFDEHGAWELQFIHHKLHLEDPPAEIRNFEITHGFNVLTFGRSWAFVVDVRVAGGVVIAHPESEVRGRAFEAGYRLTGPAFLVGCGKRLNLSEPVFLTGDVQFVAARAAVPVDGGKASTSNLSLHVLFGLGLRF